MKESRDRVGTALYNSGYRFPLGRTTINLAPAHVKKEGPSFDLPIAIGMLAAFTVSKVRWMARNEPENAARTHCVMLPHDYLTHRLVRRYVTDRGDASPTGYWSPLENRWRPDVLRVVDDTVDWGRCLPEVLGPTEPAGDREGVLVAPGTGSQQATALGIGMCAGDVVLALDRSGICWERVGVRGIFVPTLTA